MNLIKISFSLLLFSLFNFTYALDFPANVILDKASSTELDISWTQVEGAEVYAVSYGTVSGLVDGYEDELVVGAEAEVKIENLETNREYFIAIKSYDSNNNESGYSKEVSFNTLEDLSELTIDNLVLDDTRTIDLMFNVVLKKDSLASVNIINKNDDLENIEVEKYTIKDNNLNLFLYNDLKIGEKYSITIIVLEGDRGEMISAGVDGTIDFDVLEGTRKYGEEVIDDDIDLTSALSEILEVVDEDIESNNVETEEDDVDYENNQEETYVALNDEEDNNIIGNKVLGGIDVTLNSAGNQIVETVAKNNEDLPTTGPAETFLFLILSFIAGGLFLSFRNRIRV